MLFYRIKCTRCVNGIQVKPPPADSDCTDDYSCWHHCRDKRWLVDPVLKQCWSAGVSFVFYQHSHKTTVVVNDGKEKDDCEKDDDNVDEDYKNEIDEHEISD